MEGSYILLHLGAHKTATTSAQRWCADNRERLAEARICFVDFSLKPYTTYRTLRELCDRARGEGPFAQPEKRLGMVRASMRRLLASPSVSRVTIPWEIYLGEPYDPAVPRIYPRAPAAIDALAEALDGFPVRVVYTIRDQYGFLNSWYQQLFKLGRQPDPAQYVGWVGEADLSWTAVIAPLRTAFGAGNVTVLDYGAPDLFASLLESYGVEGGAETGPRENRGWPEAAVALAAFAMPKLDPPDRYRLRLLMDEAFADHPAAPFRILPPETAMRLQSRYAEENRALLTAAPELARPPVAPARL